MRTCKHTTTDQDNNKRPTIQRTQSFGRNPIGGSAAQGCGLRKENIKETIVSDHHRTAVNGKRAGTPTPHITSENTSYTHTAEVPCPLGFMIDSSPMTTGGPNLFPVMLIKLNNIVVTKNVMVVVCSCFSLCFGFYETSQSRKVLLSLLLLMLACEPLKRRGQF